MEAVEIAGIKISKIYHTANTKMEFKHPKYYAALRAERRKQQASSVKPLKIRTTSVKPQAASIKLQAASDKLLNNFSLIKFHVTRGEVLYHDKCVQRMAHMKGNLVW